MDSGAAEVITLDLVTSMASRSIWNERTFIKQASSRPVCNWYLSSLRGVVSWIHGFTLSSPYENVLFFIYTPSLIMYAMNSLATISLEATPPRPEKGEGMSLNELSSATLGTSHNRVFADVTFNALFSCSFHHIQ